ncbi:MAG: MFS transporter [Betaproteobacteria bacterium]|nr:MFS transporter [Betaproteobacteria bacterium]
MSAKSRATLVLLVASGTIISLCMGMRQSMGLFMAPVTLDIGVSAASFGFMLALQNIVWGLSQPFIGSLADRYGHRPVLFVTALSYGAGLLLMAYSHNALALDLAGFLTGIGISGTAFGVLIGVVARATPIARRSQTVGLIAAVGSLGTVVLAPVAQMLIDGHGWRAALVVFAGVAAFMALLAFAIRDPAPAEDALPPKVPQGVGDALREAMRHRGFIAMTLAYFACGFQLVFITTHLPQYLQICGVSPGVTAQALGLIGLCNTIGTYIFGHLGAHYSQKRLLASIYLFRTLFICAFLLVPVSATTTLVFAAAMGFLWLGVAPLVTGIVGRVLGLEHFNMLYGIVFLGHQVGSFFGAWIGGIIFDLTGAYSWGWAALVLIGAIAFTLQWTMDDRPPPVRREPARSPDAPAAASA